MANDAYKVLQDTSLPRALFKSDVETADGTAFYETEGVPYAAGSYVLAENISPPLRERAENGELDHLLEPADLDEALAWINQVDVGTFVAEHAVEHEALIRAGHNVVDRETAIELRSAGAEDAAKAIAAAKADGADERPNLEWEEPPNLNDEDATVGARVKGADEQYVDAEAAAEAEVQVTPSGVMATNPFVDKAAKEAEAKSSAKKSSPKPKPAASSGDGS